MRDQNKRVFRAKTAGRELLFDKLGIGRNFPNHLARWGITTAIPYAGEGRPQDPSSFVNLRTEAGWKLRNRLDATHMVAAPRVASSGLRVAREENHTHSPLATRHC